MKSEVAAQMSTKLFTGEYAYNAKFTGAYVINSTLKEIPELENFMTFVEYYCKYANEDAYCNKSNTTLAQALTVMKQWPAKMYAYNKLRQARFPGTSPQNTIDAQKAYQSKYKAAFQTCVFAGVPHTTTTLVGVTNKVHWIVSGELILLLASTCLFAWGTFIQNTCDVKKGVTDFPKSKYFRSLFLALLIAFALGMLIVHTVRTFHKSNFFYNMDDDNVFTDFGFMFIYTPIIVIWIILMAFAILLTVFIIVYNTCFANTAWTLKQWDAIPANEDSTAQDDLHYINNAYSAQICLDLTVIIGLSVTAVGITLQRGAADHSVIVSVIVLFTTIGLVSHITNVLHMIHLQAQGLEAEQSTPDQETDKEQLHKKNMRSLIFNRVLIALVIAVLLLIFFYLAGFDSAQPDFDTGNSARFASLYRFGVQEQYIFSIVVFVILVFGDLSLELKGVFFQTMYIDPNHYMYQSLSNKYTHTVWIIIVGLIILNYHAFQNLCARDGNLLTNGQLKDDRYCAYFGHIVS